ncbi:methyl-accepting chemotaxis protein [uncultured Ferrimonas sp.]|uniref:methyl-accepting chemotaxis protein n=1 Tax=uncultured Ferrimonas sp. TaxID=432640 RepID=UPI0026143D49|nr:methyl-accepting chemotaxis protein [uncultured Ferrimonas sp.]
MVSLFNIQHRSIRVQLSGMVALLIAIAFSVTGYLVYSESYQTLLTKTLTEQQSKVESVAVNLSQFFDGYLDEAKMLESAFSNGYLNGLQVASDTVVINGQVLPELSSNNGTVSSNLIVDRFRQDTGAVATVFVRQNNSLIRLSTSLSNHQGQRVVGTALASDSAAYRAIMSGKSHYAMSELFGSKYLTYYAALQDHNNRVIGASFVGIPVDEASAGLFRSLSDVRWGDSGYTTVFGNNNRNRGEFLYSPITQLIGQNLLQMDGANLYQQMFEQESGQFLYEDQRAGKSAQKYAVFAKVSGWDWVISGGTWVDEITKEAQTLLVEIIVVASLASIFTIAALSWVLARIIRPLTYANQYMTALGEGRVSVEIPSVPANSNNEITNLTYQMGQMAQRLNNLVGEIKATSQHSGESALQVAEHASCNLDQTEAQQRQVDQMAAAIEEMASSANSVAEQVEAVAHNVRSANHDSTAGVQLVSDMTGEIGNLADQLNASTDAIEKVSEESKNIQAVTNMIDAIAEQTNLLALNAAIEAARAGEQGRGFAVVADEVRQLAQRTQNSVQEVVTIISQLQSRIETSVGLMGSSQQTGDSVRQKASAAGESLQSITAQIDNIASMAENIAATSEQQAQVSSEIAANASEVSDINRKTRDTSEQTASSANELQQLSRNLSQQMDYFS